MISILGAANNVMKFEYRQKNSMETDLVFSQGKIVDTILLLLRILRLRSIGFLLFG